MPRIVPRSLTEPYKNREGDFSPDLVGQQFTQGTALFTLGNFSITTNLEPTLAKDFVTGGEWSDYYSLSTLNLTQTQSEELDSNIKKVQLNYDNTLIDRFVYFGSFVNLLQSSIEEVILNWPASIYLDANLNIAAKNTVLSYTYNSISNRSEFLLPVSTIKNNFGLIYDDNTYYVSSEGIKNLKFSYTQYEIQNDFGSFSVVSYTGSTTANPYVRVSVKGEAWPTLTSSTFGTFYYHLKPNDKQISIFYNKIDDLSKLLINTQTKPKFKLTLNVPYTSENGIETINTQDFIWPSTDGYNIDIDGNFYKNYITKIMNAAQAFDDTKTNIVARRLVSESIQEYDTPGQGDEFTGRKINKLLKVYGREFDEVKKYIDGISFANVVTYNKKDNTSDNLVKDLAKNLGLDVIETIFGEDFNILSYITSQNGSPFSGHTRDLSPKEIEIEFWRRLVINAWWLYKSKGTRKVLEFFLKLFGISECMVNLDEIVYLAKDKLSFRNVLDLLNAYGENTQGPTNITTNVDFLGVDITSIYPLDIFGFPSPLPNNSNMWFQSDGFWWNGGTDSTIGNNPHLGPYDFGSRYINNFRCFIEDFQGSTTETLTQIKTTNYFTEYDDGTFDSGPLYNQSLGEALTDNLVGNAVIQSAGVVMNGEMSTGPQTGPTGTNNFMRINFRTFDTTCDLCPAISLDSNSGLVLIGKSLIPLTDSNCCDYYYLPTQNFNVSCGDPTLVRSQGVSLIYELNGNTLIRVNGLNNQTCCTNVKLSDYQIFNNTEDVINLTDGNIGTYWDTEKGCMLNLNTSFENITQNLLNENIDIFEEEIDFFTSLTEVDNTTYNCWWCPPIQSLRLIDTLSEYLSIYSSQQIINIANNLGCKPLVGNGCNYEQAMDWLSTHLDNSIFNQGRLIVGPDNNVITNQKCCEMRGGTFDSKIGCILLPGNDCSLLNSYENFNPTFISLNEIFNTNPFMGGVPDVKCCDTMGYYWGSSYTVRNISGTTSNGPFISNITDSDIYSIMDDGNNQIILDKTKYCSQCPFDIIVDSNLLLFDSNLTPLSENCCNSLGFNYTTSGCSYCPNTILTDTTLNISYTTYSGGTYVTLSLPVTFPQYVDINGSQVSSQCCESLGGYFYTGDVPFPVIGQFCSQCPIPTPIDIVPNNLNVRPVVIGSTNYNELYYVPTNTSLSETCCSLLANYYGTTEFINNKCFLL